MFGNDNLQRVAAVDLGVTDSLAVKQLFAGKENTQPPRVDARRGLNLPLH